ncbi:MAG: DUF4838 domain-containing protein, partial [Armatimonadetes bacterium]|nr:DUF4838 domain-containing protein [Armatimonadota bacterium]
AALAATGPARREQYLLRSHGDGLYLLGASELAVRHATWDLLYRLGHRQFFPGEVWEVVPRLPEPRLAVETVELPDYLVRRIWYGFGEMDYNAAPLATWRERNRAPGAFQLNTGHAYDAIIARYPEEFRAHPEYRGLLDGERKSSKLCASNPGLRALVVRYALAYLDEHPEADTVSVDPSDGGGWCECAPCAEVGTPSDRALLLANEVAAALETQRPDKYVALYAYAYHSPPPTKVRAAPRVVVNAATSFLRGGLTVEQVIEGWQGMGVRQFGIREYYSVNTWDRDLPGAARGGNLEYLQRTVPHFHQLGALFLTSEASDNWGPNGLGYYLATRMLWDVGEAKRLAELQADFLERAFGPAREPMARFYRLLDGTRQPLLSADLVGRLYHYLIEAGRLSSDPAIRARLDHLLLYARYVDLYRTYSDATGPARQAAFEALIRHAWRMRGTMLVHTKALYRDLVSRDKAVTIPPEAAWNQPEGTNPWKSSAPFSRAELDALATAGLAANPMMGFEACAFSRDLIPATPLRLTGEPLPEGTRGRGHRVFWTWFAAPAALELKVTGGLIAHYRDRGDVRLKLLAYGDPDHPWSEVDEARVPPDGEPRTVTLRARQAGLHQVTVDDGSDMTEVVWPADVPCTIEHSAEDSPRHAPRRSAWFYVPKGTTVVGGFTEHGQGALHGPDGQEVHRFAVRSHFAVPVAPGQDGRLWSFRGAEGLVQLLTVPAYTAARGDALLLPREVVEAR